ncbi:MAG: metal-dependent hydrolase [Methanotrichaceae archaeon]|nr:metal-dependent hydrolase [Methanotrichaceae archaeon]
MLLFAHVGLTLAFAEMMRRAVGLRLPIVPLAIGSMLPDLIDKPLGYILYGTPAMGRIYAHTFLFLLLLFILMISLKNRLILAIFFGVLSHLILDTIWRSPKIFLWPLLGGFPVVDSIGVLGYLQALISALQDPMFFISETLGFAYLSIASYMLLRRELQIYGPGQACKRAYCFLLFWRTLR